MNSVCGKRIYVDMDDVLSRTTDTYAQIIAQEFGKQARFEDLVSFDLKKSFGLTETEFHHFFDLVHQPEVLLSYEPVAGALSVLSRWAEQGHHIDIVTGRPFSAKEASLAWLDAHRVRYAAFTMVDKYNRTANVRSTVITKDQLMHRRYGLAVEDSREMAIFLADRLAVPVILYDRPWNAQFLDHKRIRRACSWQEITLSPYTCRHNPG
ncbi:MAG: bifunctional metallophosphatase/5'-nucleotidase [Desulfotignum sp.]